MEGPEAHKEAVFDEAEMERLTALEGTHGVLYNGIVFRVTVAILTPNVFTFILTPLNFIENSLYTIAFYHHTDTGKLHFTAGDNWDLSFVRRFLNGYIPFDLRRFRE